MTHLESIRTLTDEADSSRKRAETHRSRAREARAAASDHEREADAFDLEALAYEESIDALQRLSTVEATA